jgi:hypothetical protein
MDDTDGEIGGPPGVDIYPIRFGFLEDPGDLGRNERNWGSFERAGVSLSG